MSNLETTQDLVEAAEILIGEKPDGNSPFRSQLLSEMNRAQRLICAGGGELNSAFNKVQRSVDQPIIFSWAKSKYPYVFNLQPAESTGTVLVTNNSSAIVFSSAPADSRTGWYIKISNDQEIYRIASHMAGDTAATLDAAYVGTTNLAATFDRIKLVYDITPSDGILQIAGPLNSYLSQLGNENDWKIDIISERAYNKMESFQNVIELMPDKAAVIKHDEATLSLIFNGFPANLERVELPYVPVPLPMAVGGQDSIIPKDLRKILSHLAAAYVMLGEDDDRRAENLTIAFSLWESLVSRDKAVFQAGNEKAGKVFSNRLRTFNKQKGRKFTSDGWPI